MLAINAILSSAGGIVFQAFTVMYHLFCIILYATDVICSNEKQ